MKNIKWCTSSHFAIDPVKSLNALTSFSHPSRRVCNCFRLSCWLSCSLSCNACQCNTCVSSSWWLSASPRNSSSFLIKMSISLRSEVLSWLRCRRLSLWLVMGCVSRSKWYTFSRRTKWSDKDAAVACCLAKPCCNAWTSSFRTKQVSDYSIYNNNRNR